MSQSNQFESFTYMDVLIEINKEENEPIYRVLTYKEEREMIDANRHDEDLIRTLLVRHNIRLVMPEVNKYRKRVHPDDLFQSGMVGILDAVERFDIDSGNKFSAYAYCYIMKHVIRSVKDHNKQFDATANYDVQSMNAPVSTAYSEDFTNGDVMYSKMIDIDNRMDITPESEVTEKDNCEYHKNLINKIIDSGIINPNEVNVIRNIYFNEKPRQLIAEEMGISKAMVGMHYKNAIRKMRSHLKFTHNIKSVKDAI